MKPYIQVYPPTIQHTLSSQVIQEIPGREGHITITRNEGVDSCAKRWSWLTEEVYDKDNHPVTTEDYAWTPLENNNG